jgi:hypothetical protein
MEWLLRENYYGYVRQPQAGRHQGDNIRTSVFLWVFSSTMRWNSVGSA